MEAGEVALIVLTMMILAGLGVLWMAMSNRRALREMEHRERLAMIQRGLMPAPEVDPLGFETATASPLDLQSPRAERWRTAGIMSIGLGLAMMMLLTFTAAAPAAGIGVGGAFAILGGTLLYNATQMNRSEVARSRRPSPQPDRVPQPPPDSARPDSIP